MPDKTLRKYPPTPLHMNTSDLVIFVIFSLQVDLGRVGQEDGSVPLELL